MTTTQVNDEQAERIDAFFGEGTYDTWHQFDVEAETQLGRKKRADTALWKADKSFYGALSPYGTDWVEKLQYDCAAAIELVKQNKFPQPDQFKPLLKIFPVALDTSDVMLELAEAIPTLWLVAGAASVPAVGFTVAAHQLHEELLELDKMLREAESEAIEAEIKSLLGIVITTVELAAPEIALAAKAGLAASEALLAGYKTPAAGTKYAKFGAEAIEHVKAAGHTVHSIAKPGGKALTVVGYYFDVEEVLHARGNVKKIKALLEKSYKEYKELEDRVVQALKGLQSLQVRIDAVINPSWRVINQKIDERDALIAQYSYSSSNAVVWKLVDDYSKIGR